MGQLEAGLQHLGTGIIPGTFPKSFALQLPNGQVSPLVLESRQHLSSSQSLSADGSKVAFISNKNPICSVQ